MEFQFLKINELPIIDKDTCYVSDFVNLLKENYTKEDILERSPLFLKERGFFEGLCPPPKPILKEEKETLTFYKNLSVSASEKLRIDSYYDCVDTSGEFFKLYKEFNEYNIKLSLEFFDDNWRKNIFYAFEQVKSNMDTFLKEKNYYISYEKSLEHLDLSLIKSYKTIVFFNKIFFTPFEKSLIERLEELKCRIKIILQCKEDEFDKENLELLSFSVPSEDIKNINIYEIKEINQALVNLDLGEKQSIVMNDLANSKLSTKLNNSLATFPADSFEETKIYKFLTMVNTLLKEVKEVDGEVVFRLEDFFNFVHDSIFARYFKLGQYERDMVKNFIERDYKYISLSIIESYIEEMQKENRLINTLKELSYIESFNKLSQFKSYFSEEDTLFNFDYESLHDRYSNSFDIFVDELCQIEPIETLGILRSNDKLWDGYFDHKSEGLLRLILKYLQFKKVSLVDEEENIKNLSFLDFDKLDIIKREKISYIGLTEGTLPSKDKDYFLLYEKERENLGLPLNKHNRLREKFKFYLSLYNSENIDLHLIKNEEKNITESSFVEELRAVKNLKTIYLDNINYKSFTKEIFGDSPLCNIEEYIKEKDYLLKENTSSINLSYYAYKDLVDCPYKYYLKNLVGIKELPKVTEKMDVRYLGILVHNIFEYASNFIRERVEGGNWEINYNSLVQKSFDECFKKHPLKYPIKYSSYYEKILFPIIKESLGNFYKKLSCLYKNPDKFQAEYEIREKIFNIDNITINSVGRIDLYLEEGGRSVFIDYKTGKGGLRQLDFYSHTLLGHNNSDKYIYSVLDQNLSEERETYDKELEMVEVEENLTNFIKDTRYRRTENKTNCNKCEYVDICHMRLGE